VKVRLVVAPITREGRRDEWSAAPLLFVLLDSDVEPAPGFRSGSVNSTLGAAGSHALRWLKSATAGLRFSFLGTKGKSARKRCPTSVRQRRATRPFDSPTAMLTRAAVGSILVSGLVHGCHI
jgi:hypothetical protein